MKPFSVKRAKAVIATITILALSSACNDSNYGANYDESINGAAMVTAFSLQKCENVLVGLDTVFFSIDLNAHRIFNADSLPQHTRVDSISVSIGTLASSAISITMPSRYTSADTTIDYIANPNAPINFSKGPVLLKVVSADFVTEITYALQVNVHKSSPDSLAWGGMEYAALPSNISSPVSQRTLVLDEDVLTLTTNASGEACISVSPTTNPAAISEQYRISMPINARVRTLTAAGQSLYVIAGDILYKSTDKGRTWTSTDVAMTHVYGTFGDEVLGCNTDTTTGHSVMVSFPTALLQACDVPVGCPVGGTSQATLFNTQWSEEPMLVVTGGRDAVGALTGASWAWDGFNWARLSVDALPPIQGVCVFPYFTFRLSDGWHATKYSALIAMGGTLADGTLSRTVYISMDRGVHWAVASALMQLPAVFPSLTGADAIVADQALSVTEIHPQSDWCGVASAVEMPVYANVCSVQQPGVTPITSWQCPYVYVYGGDTAAGMLNTQLWRGVINRLTYKPLQ